MPARILLTDAETRGALAVCRGLSASGYEVAAAAGTERAPAHWSRYCDERLSLPHPIDDVQGFVAALEDLLRSGAYAALLPGSDASLLAISHYRDRLEPHVPIGLPPHDVVLAAVDKLMLAGAAEEAGLRPPETGVCWSVEEVASEAARLGFPAVLKPIRSVFVADGELRRSGSVRVEDEAALRRWAPELGEPCLVQRAEHGQIVSFAGAIWDGRLTGVAFSRYLRTWYPEAGNVAFSESFDPPAELRRQVEELLRELRWQGLFEVELIERADGSHTPIDLNPRVYGSMALAVAAGANLPAIWCARVLGERPKPVAARAGHRYRWEDADLRHALWQARRGHLVRAIGACVPRRRVTHAHFSLSDPGPFFARALYLAGLARRRGRPSPAATTEPDVRDPAPKPRRRRRRSRGEVAVLGAGPYGLAVTSHLRRAGVPVRVFGEPLEYWRNQMPEGMILRSRKRSSHIADPEGALTIDRFAEAEGRKVRVPSLTLEEFVDYGIWYQRRAVPDVDRRKVRTVGRDNGHFRLQLEDGDEITAQHLVVAAGLFPFGRRPAPFDSLPAELVSHSADHRDLRPFADRKVLVVGAGQSALEGAALLAEAGAHVEVLARTSELYWLPDDEAPPPKRGLRERLPLPPTDIGGFSTGWAAALPDVYRRLPPRLRPVVTYRCIRPAGSAWLRPRLEHVRIDADATAVSAEQVNGGVRIGLADGSEREVEHVLLGTGYEIDVRRYPFLAPELASEIEVVAGGSPRLRAGLESSVPGLYFAGASAAISFGPIMRFVVGTWYAAPSVTRRILRRPQPPLRRSYCRF